MSLPQQRLREACLEHDTACAIHRIEFTQDRSELDDLTPTQLRMLLERMPAHDPNRDLVAQHLAWRTR